MLWLEERNLEMQKPYNTTSGVNQKHKQDMVIEIASFEVRVVCRVLGKDPIQ